MSDIPSGPSPDGAPAVRSKLQAEWNAVFTDETEWLRRRQPGHHSLDDPGTGRDYLTGLCLSGGGIRSATVALGILQSFARQGLIKHFDYLSSVSGGGYIGSSLVFRYAQARQAAEAAHQPPPDPDKAFPFAPTTREEKESRSLTYLRNHGYYLTPTGIAGTATGALVVARALLLNLFIWITLGAWVLSYLMWGFMQLRTRCLVFTDRPTCGHHTFFDWLVYEAIGLGILLVAMMVGFSLSSFRLKTVWSRASIRAVPWPLLALLGFGLAGLFAYRALGSLDPRAVLHATGPIPVSLPWFIAATAALLASLSFASLALGLDGAAERHASGARKYARRRFQEQLAGHTMLVIGGMLVLGLVPVLPTVVKAIPFLKVQETSSAGPLSVVIYLIGLGAALYGYYRTHLRGFIGMGSAFIIVAGSAFLCFGAVVVAYAVAEKMVVIHTRVWPDSLDGALIFAAPLIALALCLFVSLNEVSLGAFYRDRLMEAYLPDEPIQADADDATDGPPRTAFVANRFPLTDILNRGKAGKANGHGKPPPAPVSLVGPYPLINANIVARGCGDSVARRRGGDNFLLSPGWCGSTTTSWQKTTQMSEGYLTLANAMAISGAAANPRGGFGGSGPTTSPVVSLAMSLLSIRLGAWLRWKSAEGRLGRLRSWLNPRGNHLFPSAFSLLNPEGSTWVELSDGGHFENLGIYELIRRRCGLIVVCDGGDDPKASYAALTVAARRIEEDFATTVALDFRVRGKSGFERSGPESIVPRKVDDEYPKDAEFARRGYFLGSIRYGDPKLARVPMAETGPSVGLLIYIKSAMIPSVAPTSRGYKGANPEFPHESTVDQFFSPEQFEAYRDVGVCVADQMLEETKLKRLFHEGRPTIWGLCNTLDFNCAGVWETRHRPAAHSHAAGTNGNGKAPREHAHPGTPGEAAPPPPHNRPRA